MLGISPGRTLVALVACLGLGFAGCSSEKPSGNQGPVSGNQTCRASNSRSSLPLRTEYANCSDPSENEEEEESGTDIFVRLDTSASNLAYTGGNLAVECGNIPVGSNKLVIMVNKLSERPDLSTYSWVGGWVNATVNTVSIPIHPGFSQGVNVADILAADYELRLYDDNGNGPLLAKSKQSFKL